jgi:hypothetical protein
MILPVNAAKDRMDYYTTQSFVSTTQKYWDLY